MGRVLIGKLIVTQLVKEFSDFYGTRRFITASQEHDNCPYPEPDASIPQLLTLFPQNPF